MFEFVKTRNEKEIKNEISRTIAGEFDFANKWAECVGQASYYGLMTNKMPVCAIIIENKERDAKYIKRLEKLKEKLQFEIIEIVPKNTVTNP
jgi:hypothetical protein